jgi:hypothetical protein
MPALLQAATRAETLTLVARSFASFLCIFAPSRRRSQRERMSDPVTRFTRRVARERQQSQLGQRHRLRRQQQAHDEQCAACPARLALEHGRCPAPPAATAAVCIEMDARRPWLPPGRSGRGILRDCASLCLHARTAMVPAARGWREKPINIAKI